MVKIKRPDYFFGSFLSGLKNALLKNNSSFLIHYSRFNSIISEYFLKNHFFSEVFYLFSNKNKDLIFIFIILENYEGKFVLNEVKTLAGRSRYIFMSKNDLKRRFLKEKSVFLLSTSEGIANSLEALRLGVGGIVLFEYY